MFKKIFMGYAAVVLAFLRFIAVMIVCIGTGFLVVFPLWKLSASNPAIYTLAFTVIFLLLSALFAGKAMYTAYTRNPGRFFLSLSRKTTLFSGIFISIVLVLNYERAIALIVLIVTLCLYGFLAFVLSANSRPKKP